VVHGGEIEDEDENEEEDEVGFMVALEKRATSASH